MEADQKSAKSGLSFNLYNIEQDGVIVAEMAQVDDGKEYITTYLHRLLEAKTRYVFNEKLCTSLCYICTKFRHFLLSSIRAETIQPTI